MRAGSRKHTVVQIPQKIGHIRAQVRIIFDDENGLHPLTFGKGFFGIAFGRTGIPIVTGEIHSDAGALTYFTVDLHMSAGLFNETIYLAQAKARTLSRLFGGEKRLEGVIENVGGHSGASVRHAHDNILPRRKLRIYPAIVLVG